MENKENIENKKVVLSFAAIDQYVVDNIIKPTEIDSKKGFISWGDNNNYPNYIQSLYKEVATLKSIVDGLTDYVCGDEISVNKEQFKDSVNQNGETLADIIQMCVKDYCIYGGFSVNVIMNKLHTIAEIHYLDFKNVRSNEDGTEFYYSKDWSKSYGRVKYLTYPKFNPEDKEHYSFIYYFKNEYNQTYPTPIYGASLIACEIEKCINQYHLNSIHNNFEGSVIVNFNGGKPSDEQKEEIEENFYEKYTSYENASRPVLSFNDSKDHETTISKIDTEDFGERYKTLSERSKQELFTAFRATPMLFGIMQENIGFNRQEFAESFSLFNKTMVKPIQNKIKKAFERILGEGTEITITPFKVNFEGE